MFSIGNEEDEEEVSADPFTKLERDIIIEYFSNTTITVSNIKNGLFIKDTRIHKRYIAYFQSRFPDREVEWPLMFNRMIRQWGRSRK